jgi:hypothetical protein
VCGIFLLSNNQISKANELTDKEQAMWRRKLTIQQENMGGTFQ